MTTRAGSSGAARALRDLRRARRRRAYGDIDWVDALYKAYVTAIFSAIGASIASGYVGGKPVTPAQLATAMERGPALVGLVVAVALAAGLRSGGRGGPLALQPADVQLVLLAPLPRRLALRAPATRQLRSAAFAGALTGMVAGNLAAQRLPGSYAAWVAWGALAGLVAGMAWTGSALTASGARIGRRWAGALGALVLGWPAVDLWAGTATAPTSLLGRLAMSAVDASPSLRSACSSSASRLPASCTSAARRWRRPVASRAGRAAAVRPDHAGPADRPPAPPPAGGGRPPPPAVAAPARRPAPEAGVAAGLAGHSSLAGDEDPAHRAARRGRRPGRGRRLAGTPALVLASAAALLVAGLDSVEGQAQEADHMVRRDTLPVHPGSLLLRHLAAPSVVMTGVVAVAAGGALAMGGPTTVLAVAAVVGLPAALAVTSGAALSVQTGPIDPFALEPFAGVRLFLRSVGPGVLAVAGVLLVVAAAAVWLRRTA